MGSTYAENTGALKMCYTGRRLLPLGTQVKPEDHDSDFGQNLHEPIVKIISRESCLQIRTVSCLISSTVMASSYTAI